MQEYTRTYIAPTDGGKDAIDFDKLTKSDSCKCSPIGQKIVFKRTSEKCLMLNSLEVYSNSHPNVNLALDKSVVFSGSEGYNGSLPEYIKSAGYHSNCKNGDFVSIDLGQEYSIDRIVVRGSGGVSRQSVDQVEIFGKDNGLKWKGILTEALDEYKIYPDDLYPQDGVLSEWVTNGICNCNTHMQEYTRTYKPPKNGGADALEFDKLTKSESCKCSPIGQKIIFKTTEDNSCTMLRGLEVYSNLLPNVNLARDKSVVFSGSPTYNGSSVPSDVLDKLYHSNCKNGDFLSIDLGQEYSIDKIIIRGGGNNDRRSASEVSILGANDSLKWKAILTDIKSEYIWEPEYEPKEGDYKMYDNADAGVGSENIECIMGGVSSDVCRVKCDANGACNGYNYVKPGGPWGEKGGCCYKKDVGVLNSSNGITFYKK
jgi:hypothetical protein